jgi:hypothetical protein
MLLVVLRIGLAPLLVAFGTLVQRRWGDAVGGLIAGLPLTSVPLLLLFTLSQGPSYAARAAVATLSGVAAQAVLIWVFARCAGRTAVVAVGAGLLAFAVAAAILAFIPLTALPAAVLATGVLTVVLVLWPRDAGAATVPDREPPSTMWPRMIAVAIFTMSSTALARVLGPHLAGLASSLPILAVVMFAFTRAEGGTRAARHFALGVGRATYSVIVALAVVALLLPTGRTALAFAAAVASAFAVQCATEVCRRTRVWASHAW